MSRISVSKLKARLSQYLREVRRGGEVEILDRGVPVARLTGLPSPQRADDRRKRLIRSGVLRPGRGNVRFILATPPIELSTSILEALEEERDDRV